MRESIVGLTSRSRPGPQPQRPVTLDLSRAEIRAGVIPPVVAGSVSRRRAGEPAERDPQPLGGVVIGCGRKWSAGEGHNLLASKHIITVGGHPVHGQPRPPMRRACSMLDIHIPKPRSAHGHARCDIDPHPFGGVAREMFQALFGERDLSDPSRFWTDASVDDFLALGKSVRGKDALAAFFGGLFAAFPDWKLEIEQAFDDGDRRAVVQGGQPARRSTERRGRAFRRPAARSRSAASM